MVLVWLSLGISIAVLAGSIAFLVVRTLAAWRGFRSCSRVVSEASLRLTEATDAAAAKAGALEDGSGRLAEATARLARSRARLAILTAALADVRAGVERATWVVPRK